MEAQSSRTTCSQSFSWWMPEKPWPAGPTACAEFLSANLSLEHDLVPGPFEVWCQPSNHSACWPAAQHPSRIFSLFLWFEIKASPNCLIPDTILKKTVYTQKSLHYTRPWEQTSHLRNSRRGRIGRDTCWYWNSESIVLVNSRRSGSRVCLQAHSIPSDVLVKSRYKDLHTAISCAQHTEI